MTQKAVLPIQDSLSFKMKTENGITKEFMNFYNSEKQWHVEEKTLKK
jgi:hypothetical protein